MHSVSGYRGTGAPPPSASQSRPHRGHVGTLLPQNRKQLVDACSVCFDRPDVFTPQVLATSLQQMVEFTPLPLLFMRTVIQAETIAPQLREFTLGLLRTLVNRQVWKMDQKIWEGYLRCLKRAAPQSYPLMVELPAPVLGEVLDKFPALRDGLKTFATRSSVPKAIAAILNASN